MCRIRQSRPILRFDIQYPTGATHEVEVSVRIATVGRDPTSDVVLNDPKCSRRHAVIEVGAEGMIVRDSGSANGVYVNGRKVERSRIRPGDTLKMGDVTIRVLTEEPGTLIVEDVDGMAGRTPPPPSSPPPAPPRSWSAPPVGRANEMEMATVLPSSGLLSADAVRAMSAGVPPDAPADSAEALPAPSPRPLTVRAVLLLWALAAPALVIATFALAWEATGFGRALVILLGLALASLAVTSAYGLWVARPWAHTLQIAAGGVLLFICPFTVAAIVILAYMLRPEARWHFSERRGPPPSAEKEVLFTSALAGAVVLGLLLTAGATFLARTARAPAGGDLVRATPAERTAVEQLRALAAAEEAFRGVCNTGYGDLDALRRPGTVIENYPSDGPAFLRDPVFDQSDRDGYRFELKVADEMPKAPGCPARRFRRFQYAATPLGGQGRHLVIGPDGVARGAQGRPATGDDPPLL